MRRRIGLLTAATTSAIVVAFVIPLFLLVRVLAENRAIANADQEARNIAILVSAVRSDAAIDRLVDSIDEASTSSFTVLTPDGDVLGTPVAGLADDPLVTRARSGEAFTDRAEDATTILVPVVTPPGTYVVRTVVPEAELHRGVPRAWTGVGLLGLLLLAGAVVIADRLGKRVSTPVSDLAVVAHQLREGDLDARAVPSGPRETVELGHALNRLAERIIELLATERAAIGDLSHRLRTPVTALRLDVESVRDPDVSARLHEHVTVLQRTIDALVKEARRSVRSDMGSRCDAAAVVRERVAFWSALADDQRRAYSLEVSPVPEPVPLTHTALGDIVDVLLDNVFAHTPEGTAFSLLLERRSDQVHLEVVDEGPSLHHDNEEREGFSGLGLQIVRRTVGKAGGRITVQLDAERGSRVAVSLPLDLTDGRHSSS